MKINFKVYLLLLVPLFTTTELNAAIYKCINAKSEVFYNDKPCPVEDKESQMQAVKDPEGGYIPPEFVADPTQKASKGVVVGSSNDNAIENKKDKSVDSSSNSSSNGSSSENTSTNNNSTSDGVDKSADSSSTIENNSIAKGSSQTPVKKVADFEGYYKDPE